ncbi:hypothetical protein BJ085DRAFT_42542 [Dimargaris cristalligena]|uniref:Protein farnesyltransferase/geranylgeranyltransferase type-1 subunit alpha n=1 Tax=Dimargaris cristalligena TaxID=215637 RepID=A0A4Q0A381_9FUNG|nr:hypothetical protein BJ085DRAFT_42542 [Dimargaris cristalligena]|eukprot:RKP40338.1 hypothetical protein BJ085DRAFT_42542 [Dimargaris cristalligena]
MQFESDDLPLSQRAEWKDVTPIPQDDGLHPIAPISYTKEYSEVMDYFRAISRQKELSPRALQLTEEIIWINPGHYTAWAYRLDILKHLNVDLRTELTFLDEFAEENPKTYQLWHHRREIIKLLDDPSGEMAVIAKILQEDSKNFHAWSYRQWILTRFQLWEGELTYIELMLDQDVRNNSAWNQRYFVVTRGNTVTPDSGATLQREIDYSLAKIRLAPNNESPWVYCRG